MGLFFRDKKKGGSRPPYQGGKHYGGHKVVSITVDTDIRVQKRKLFALSE